MEELKFTSFEDACKHLGIDTCLPDTNLLPIRYAKAIEAHYKLMVLAEAHNNGWVADYEDYDQRKYFPWFDYVPGSGWMLYGYEDGSALTVVGARLALKSGELAKYMGETFLELYSDMFGGQK